MIMKQCGESVNYFAGWIYLCAFCSLYVQFPGLYSVNGILPMHDFLKRISQHYDDFAPFPSVLRFASEIGVSTDAWCEFLLLIGIWFSLAICLGVHRPLFFFVLWIVYLSFYLAGQTFLSFQWDILLLETGFLVMLNSLLQYTTAGLKTTNWCFRFLIWKLMFMAGVVKLQSKCPTWDHLTALEYHFATQCLPNSFAWYMHQLHPLILRLGVAATLLIEIPFTFLLISPFRLMRQIGAVLQASLQVLIIATGNYNFFNLLTLMLLFPVWESDNLLTGEPLGADTERKENSRVPTRGAKSRYGVLVQVIVTLTGMLLSASYMLQFDVLPYVSIDDGSSPDDWMQGVVSHMDRVRVALRDKFEVNDLVTPCSIAAMGLCLCFLLGQAVLECVWHIKSMSASPGLGRLRILWRIVVVLISAAVGCFYIQFSAVPLSQLGSNLNPYIHSTVLSTSQIREVNLLHISSGYGLFRSMTGVGSPPAPPASLPHVGGLSPSVVARPEIIMEGLDAVSGEWQEIHFRHKPGDTLSPPTFVMPHQPRLDWQMWFAALGHYSHNPWFVHLIYKLQQGNCPEVIALLDETRYPFKDKPPIAIRSTLYDYDFTRLNTSWARAIPGVELVGDSSISGRANHAWWQRKGPGREYLGAIDKNNPSVKEFLKGNGLVLRKRVTSTTKSKDLQCIPNSEQPGLLMLHRAICRAPDVRLWLAFSEEQWFRLVNVVLVILLTSLFVSRKFK